MIGYILYAQASVVSALCEDGAVRRESCAKSWDTVGSQGTEIEEKCNSLQCDISISHGCEYDVQNCLLGCTA
jgi:hypothetical protein